MRTKTRGFPAMREPGRTESRQPGTGWKENAAWKSRTPEPARAVPEPGGENRPPGRDETSPTAWTAGRPERPGTPAPARGPGMGLPEALPGSPGLAAHVPAAPPGCPRDPAGGRQEDRTGKTADRRPDGGATAAGCPRKRPRRRSTASQSRSPVPRALEGAKGPSRANQGHLKAYSRQGPG